MKKIIILLIILFSAQITLARELEFRAYYPKTGKTFQCQQLKWGSKGITCYSIINGKLKSQGIGILQQFTGLYDGNGLKMYEGDRVSSPNIPNGTIIWLATQTIVGWWIMGDDGNLYKFSNLSTLPVSEWSIIIK